MPTGLLASLDHWGRTHPAAALFAIALALRLALGLALNEGLRGGVLYHPDSEYYLQQGAAIRANWDQGNLEFPDYPRFAILVAAASYLHGDGYAVVWTLTLLVGAAAAPLAWAGLRHAGLPQAAPWAGAFLAFEPTGLYYSTQLLRDAWFVSAALLLAWATLAMAPWRPRLAVAASALSVFEILNRPNQGRATAGLLALALLVATVLTRFPKHRAWILGAAGGLGALAFLAACSSLGLALDAGAGAPPSHVPFFPDPTPDWRNGSCIWALVTLLPAALLALVHPLPWLAQSGVEVAFAGAMLTHYAAYLAGGLAWWQFPRPFMGTSLTRVLGILGVPALGLLAHLGLAVHVTGPLIRWRLVPVAFLLVCLAMPMPELWGRVRGRARATRAR